MYSWRFGGREDLRKSCHLISIIQPFYSSFLRMQKCTVLCFLQIGPEFLFNLPTMLIFLTGTPQSQIIKMPHRSQMEA